MNLPEIHVVKLEDLEAFDSDLLACRKNRNLVEYYFTCTPSWLLYLFQKFSEPDVFTYLDADLFFFSDPAPVYEEFATASIGIIAHRFPPELKEMEKFGIYNVGWLSFRRDTHAAECLRWWRERCLEWCYDRPEEGRFADQKYLDDWPSRFRGVTVLQNKGANVAPWNIRNTRFTEVDSRFYVDKQPLIFYHFHLLKALTPYLYDHGLYDYDIKLDASLKKVYVSYLRELRKRMDPSHSGGNRIRYKKGNFRSSLLHRRTLAMIGPLSFELNLEPITRVARYVKRLIKV